MMSKIAYKVKSANLCGCREREREREREALYSATKLAYCIML